MSTEPLLRLAHLADTHIGMENYGRLNPETGLNQRLHDFLRSLDEALDQALAAGVDLVVIAGDIYKTRDPSPTHQNAFARRVHRLATAGVPVFIAAGNHDIPMSTGRSTSIDIFRSLEVPNVTIARVVGAYRVETRRGPVQILAFPWSVRSAVLAQADFKNKTLEQVNELMIAVNREKLRSDAEQLDPGLPTIVVGHAHLLGGRVGAERLLTMGNDPMYDVRTFDVPNVDYVAMGHLHKHQAVSYLAPPIVYAGSIDRVDFGEEEEDKGWVYVEIPEKGRAEWQFRKVNARPFLTVQASLESDNPTEDVIRAIARAGDRVKDAVVRLRIEGAADRMGQLRDDDIRAQLKGAYYLAPVERQVQRHDREPWGRTHSGIQHAEPIQALEYFFEQHKVDAERREVLLRYARQLIAGDDHDHALEPEPAALSSPPEPAA